jgi:hypothetical protein
MESKYLRTSENEHTVLLAQNQDPVSYQHMFSQENASEFINIQSPPNEIKSLNSFSKRSVKGLNSDDRSVMQFNKSVVDSDLKNKTSMRKSLSKE